MVRGEINRLKKLLLENLKYLVLKFSKLFFSERSISLVVACIAVYISIKALNIQIEATRPYIRIADIHGYRDAGLYEEVQVGFENIGVHPASDLSVIVYSLGKELHSSNYRVIGRICFSILGELVGSAVEPIKITRLPDTGNESPRHVLIRFEYSDSVVNKHYTQLTWSTFSNNPPTFNSTSSVQKIVFENLLKNLPITCD